MLTVRDLAKQTGLTEGAIRYCVNERTMPAPAPERGASRQYYWENNEEVEEWIYAINTLRKYSKTRKHYIGPRPKGDGLWDRSLQSAIVGISSNSNLSPDRIAAAALSIADAVVRGIDERPDADEPEDTRPAQPPEDDDDDDLSFT